MDQETKFQSEYEEINIADYIRVILKRKWVIFIVFLAVFIATAVFSFYSSKIYQIDTSLEMGTIEPSSQVVEKIQEDVYGILVREKLGIPEEEFPKIKAENPQGTDLIKIKIESGKPQRAKTILEEMNNTIIKDHQERIRTERELIKYNIKAIEVKIQLIESDIEKIRNKIGSTGGDIKRIENKINYAEEEKKNLEAKIAALEQILIYEQTPGTQFALFDAKEKLAGKKQEIEDLFLSISSLKTERENLSIDINALGREIENLKSQINSLEISLDNLDNFKLTRIVKNPVVSMDPIKPKPLFNMAIAGVLGLFAGIFLVFGKEWWEKNQLKI